jgi:hypothetical protein
MKNRTTVKTRTLPFTVVYTVDGVTTKKRFTEAGAAWSFMSKVGGHLNMAFRTA